LGSGWCGRVQITCHHCKPGVTFKCLLNYPQNALVCFVWISEKTAFISVHDINVMVFIIVAECVYCAVRSV
jgi:hypothetical protein